MKMLTKIKYRKASRGLPVYFLLFLLFFTSCKKDKISNECRDIDYSPLYQYGPITQIVKKFEGEVLRAPSFNPNNDNEILFMRNKPSSSNQQLYIYNLTNQSKVLIYEGQILGKPSWGKNDYILFYTLGGHIWKIRSDGQDLTYLNNPVEVYHPQWSSLGTKFAANAPIYQAPNQLIIFDENGMVLDSLPLPISPNYVERFTSQSSFEREDILVLRRSSQITFFDTENEVILDTYYTQVGFEYETGSGGNIFWLDSTKLIYGNRDGIHQITYPGLQNTHLVKGCTDKVYSSGSLNSSKTKIVWGVGEEEVKGDQLYVLVRNYLVLMNVDGSNEQRLEIDF